MLVASTKALFLELPKGTHSCLGPMAYVCEMSPPQLLFKFLVAISQFCCFMLGLTQQFWPACHGGRNLSGKAGMDVTVESDVGSVVLKETESAKFCLRNQPLVPFKGTPGRSCSDTRC